MGLTMECEPCFDRISEILDLGEGPLITILSFCDLPTVSRVAQTNHNMHRVVQAEWSLRDALYSMDQKSRAVAPRERLQRWAVGQACIDEAMATPQAPQRVLIEPSDEAETMLRLFSVSRGSVLWEGFLPRSGYSSSGWQLEVGPLQQVWRQVVHASMSSSLELLSQAVEDLVIAVAIVDQNRKTHLVACTQGVALSQRQHNAAAMNMSVPATFVLRQQWLQGLPVVVHLSLRTDATALTDISVSYFCVR